MISETCVRCGRVFTGERMAPAPVCPSCRLTEVLAG